MPTRRIKDTDLATRGKSCILGLYICLALLAQFGLGRCEISRTPFCVDMQDNTTESCSVKGTFDVWESFGPGGFKLEKYEDNTNFSYYFRPTNRSGAEPFNKTAYQMPTLLKVLGKACSRATWTTVIAMRDFCENWNVIYQRFVDGDCRVDLPFLTRDEWLEVLEERETKTRVVERGSFIPFEFDLYNVYINFMGELYDFNRKGLRGELNFVPFTNAVRSACALFVGLVLMLGISTFFWDSEKICDVQGEIQGAEDAWEKILRRGRPGVQIRVRKRKEKGLFVMVVDMDSATSKVRYTSKSEKSYGDAFMYIMLRLPTRKDIKVQGVIEFAGFKETPGGQFLVSIAFFVYAYYRSRSTLDRIMAVTQWFDTLHTIGKRLGFHVQISDLYGVFTKLACIREEKKNKKTIEGHRSLEIDISFEEDIEGNIQASFAECASEMNNFFKGVLNSSSIRACFRLVAFVWHILFVFKDGKVDWDHLAKWNTVMFQSIPEQALNLGNVLLEQISNLAQCSYEFYQTRDPNVFLRNDNEVTSYLEAVEKITAEVKRFPVEATLNTEMQDIERRIHELIAKGEVLRPRVKLTLRSTFTSGLLQLRSLALDVSTTARASSSRAAPFTLLITGAPKIGKSSITSLIFKQFQQTNPYNTVLENGLVLQDNGVYTRTLKEEYWSCYMNSFWGLLYDDLGQTNPKCPDFALEINEIIQVVNNVMYFPQMAGVEEKGRRYVAPQIVVATSNNKDLNSHHAVRSPGAVLRRFPFVVTPKLRPEFATDNTLDAKKIGDNDVDLWTFRIEEVVLGTNGAVSYREVHAALSTPLFLKWVNDQSLLHYRGQAKSDSYLKKIQTSARCATCNVLSMFCTCSGAATVSSSAAPPAMGSGPVAQDSSAVVAAAPGPAAVLNPQAPAFMPDLVSESDDENCEIQPEEPRRRTRQRPELRARRVRAQPQFCKSETDTSGSEDDDIYEEERTYTMAPMIPNVSGRVQFVLPVSMGIVWFLYQLAKSVFAGYSSVFILLWCACQMWNLAAFMERIATKPLLWFCTLASVKNQRKMQEDGNQYYASTMSYFWRFWANFYQFDAQDNATLLWLMGWQSTAAWCNKKIVEAKTAVNNNPKTVAAICVLLATAGFAAWYFSSMDGWDLEIKPQGVCDGIKPPDADASIVNEWKASQNLSFTAFLNKKSRTGGEVWFRDAIAQATATMSFSNKALRITGFNVFGSYWLVPRHYVNKLPEGDQILEILRGNSLDGKMGAVRCAFNKRDALLCDTADYALLKLPTQPGPNLLPYIAKVPIGAKYSADQLFLRSDGINYMPAEPIVFAERRFTELSEMAGLSTNTVFRLGTYMTMFESLNGDCGSPCVILTKGNLTILGTHVGYLSSDPRSKLVNTLPIEWLEATKNRDESCVVQGSLDTTKLDGTEFNVRDDVHEKCPLRFEGLADMPNGNSAIPIGQIEGIALNRFSTRVAENAFASFWKGCGYVTSKVRPVLSSVQCPSWMPKRNFLLNACQHKDLIPSNLIRLSAAHYSKSFVDKVPLSSIKKCVVIDEETNLYGAENNNFISHMRFDTGAGFPHNKPKYEVMARVAHDRFPQGTCALTPDLKKRIDDAETTLSKGERVNFVFNSSLKDEPISENKLKLGKVRVFQAICLEGLFLLRKYFLSLIALFQTWNFASEAAIGMDATGPDWDDLHDHIYVDGWKIFCGDYSNYDQRMGSSIMMAAWGILIDIAMLSCNYPWIAIRIMWTLAVECCYCTVNFFGDLICLNGSNPSGHGLTVVINSICNSLYIRIAWLEIFGNLDHFLEFIRIMTYGDDNIISVHPEVQDRFNQVTVTEALAKYGIVYTDALKTGNAAKPFCEPGEISFLKRGFVKSEYGFWLAPLEVASIHKMLIIGVNSGKVQENDRLSSVLISSVMEAYQHGREFFDQHRNLTIECMNQYNLSAWVESKGGLPTYQMLTDRRLAKISRKGLLHQVVNQRAPGSTVTSLVRF